MLVSAPVRSPCAVSRRLPGAIHRTDWLDLWPGKPFSPSCPTILRNGPPPVRLRTPTTGMAAEKFYRGRGTKQTGPMIGRCLRPGDT